MGYQAQVADIPFTSGGLSDAVVGSSSTPRLPSASPEGSAGTSTSGNARSAGVREASRVVMDRWKTGKLLLAGGVSGAVSKTATAPLARMTILYQVGALQTSHSMAGLSAGLRNVVRLEGVRALWKGNGVTMMHRLPYTATNFYLYEQVNQALLSVFPTAASGTTGADSLRRLLAGGFAGSVACTVAYPLDLVRTRLAAQTGDSRRHYRGISHAFQTIIAHEGLSGLYRGLRPTLLQAGPNLALNYCAYEGFRSRWLAHHPADTTPPVHVSLVCGSLAGMASSTVTFPLDVIRRRMQMQGAAGSRMRYSGVLNAISTVFRHEGMRGFYAGIVPEYIKVAPGVAITYCTYEAMKLFLLGDEFNARR